MASHDSAIKKQRQDRRRRQENRSHLSRLKTEIKRLRTAIAAGGAEEARKSLPSAEALLDHSATLGVIHRNAASRTKSRLAHQVSSLEGA